MNRAIFRSIGWTVLGLLFGAGNLLGQQAQTGKPLQKLDRKELTPLDIELLPDIAVAVTNPPAGSKEVVSCSLSVDGKLATATRDGKATLWDLTGKTPRQLQTIELEAGAKFPFEEVRFSPDGKRLVYAHGGVLNFYDVSTDGLKFFASKDVGVRDQFTFHPTQPFLVYSANNVGRGIVIGEHGLDLLPWQMRGTNSALTFSPDGKLFSSVVFSPERNGELYGSEIATLKVAADRTMTGFMLLQQLRGFKAIAYSPDGHWMATGSLDKFIRIWDLRGDLPAEKAKIPMAQWVKSVYFSGGGDYVVGVSSTNQIMLIKTATGAIEKEWVFVPRRGTKFAEGAMFNLFSTTALAPDGRHLAFSNYTPHTVVLRLPIAEKP
jgi:WD40 repeat protein